ncbi:MAG: 30S ribosomal protein S20, partial [Pseudomonadales bacterium]
TAVADGDHDKAAAAYKDAMPLLDRAVTHGIIRKNKAARHKSRLNAKIKALQA